MGATISSWIAENAPQVPNIAIDDSAAGCMKVLREAKLEDALSFFDFDGTRIPW
jgi:hypothetical protein